MKVFLGMPYYPGGVDAEALIAGLQSGSDGFETTFCTLPSMGTAKGFNVLWAKALEAAAAGEITHFAMLHADVIPEYGWLGTLLEECERLKADMVSVVVPIKDDRGVTSCGCDWQAGDPWHVKRFTMTEIFSLPDTFSTEDTIATGLNPGKQPLLVNTGCWVADMRRPLWFETNEKNEAFFHFTLNDRIVRTGNQWAMETESEDWFFSRRLASRGGRYFATRKVRVKHVGKWNYRNDVEWGRWQTEEVRPCVSSS